MIRSIGHLETRLLRHNVLRPHQRPEDLFFTGDDAADTGHFGAFDSNGGLVGVASVYRTAADPSRAAVSPLIVGDRAWQLRGMATDPSVRGQGKGGELLLACLAHASALGGAALWCNARSSVRGFYERFGLRVEGPEFSLPNIGPHLWMWIPIGRSK